MTKPPRRFAIRCLRATFSEDEVQALQTYGCQFEDLIAGRRPCRTPAQRQFVEVAKGQGVPKTYYERLWRKYVVRLQRELQQRRGSTAAAQAADRSAASRPPTTGPVHHVPNDRKDWKRMRGRQWGDAMRRGRGDD